MQTTRKDFSVFKRECKKWIKKLHLVGWDVRYINDDEENNTGACFWNGYESRNVTINFNKTQEEWIFNRDYIKEVAFHEVVESMLIGKLRWLARERYVTEVEINEACHEIIHILKLVIYNKEKINDC